MWEKRPQWWFCPLCATEQLNLTSKAMCAFSRSIPNCGAPHSHSLRLFQCRPKRSTERGLLSPNPTLWHPAPVCTSVKVKSLSRVQLLATPWTVAYQDPPTMGFSRQECWSGLPLPSPGDLPNPGIELGSPALQADALPSEPPGKCNHPFQAGPHQSLAQTISGNFILS